MNQIVATVQEINHTDIVSYIKASCSETILILIKTKVPSWLCIGDEIECNFQETSVSVSKDCPGKISIENMIPVRLKEVRKSESLCELTFESDIGNVISLITMRAYDALELEEGCKATILLRGVDINIEPILSPINTNQYDNLRVRTKNAD